MSNQVLFKCTSPECTRTFLTQANVSRHMKQSVKCQQWIDIVLAAPVNQPVAQDVVPGSIFDLRPEDAGGAGDGTYGENDIPPPAEDDEYEDDDSGEDSDGEAQHSEDEEAKEAEARARIIRDYIDERQDEEDLFTIQYPNIAIGEAGPGPQTTRHRLGQMIGSRARFLDDDTNEDGADDDIIVEHPTAARTLIQVAVPLYERWEALFGAVQERLDHLTEDAMDVDDSGPPDLAGHNLYFPFASKMDWDIAHWMVTEGISHSALNRLLKIDGVRESLGLSFENTRGLHQKVDEIPGRAGKWYTKKIVFPDRPDEVFYLRHRNILDAIQALWGDPELAEHLVYKPKKMFHRASEETEADSSAKGARFYNEMWTGKYWWYIQDKLPNGHTLAPVIIATDKTQLTQFSGSRQAYPVYLTLGNIPNSLRRKPSQQACILLGYLPVNKLSRGKLSKASMGARYQKLFHTAMRSIVEPLIKAGSEGVRMTSGDGTVRIVHPILAAYVADYPEQCLVTCSKYGTCPKCQCPHDELQESTTFPLRTPAWTRNILNEAKNTTTSNSAYLKACKAKNVNGNVSEPFWDNLPYTDLHLSTTPDVLHQLYQGVLRHLIEWCQQLMDEKEFDRRIRRLPPGLGLRHFKNGLSVLSQISGAERKAMGKILLGIIADELDERAVTACRAILDFIYLAQYATHDDDTLQYMDDALELWHKYKTYFTDADYGTRDHINIPKFHALQHYVQSIKLFGMTNNFNTEMFERLHIEFSKKGWRASNHRDEFPQMTTWVTRQENVQQFERFIAWAQKKLAQQTVVSSSTVCDTTLPIIPDNEISLPPPRRDTQSITLAKHPTTRNKGVRLIERQHAIPGFPSHLLSYLNALETEEAKRQHRPVHSFLVLPFQGVNIWHSFRFTHKGFDNSKDERDWVKASPLNGGRFDTVVVLHQATAASTSLEGTRIGRVRAIFTLPEAEKTRNITISFPKHWPKEPLAYVQWYTAPKLTKRMRESHNMVSVKKAFMPDGVTAQWSIIPLTNVRQSCMLFPRWSLTEETLWDTPTSVLDTCNDFYVNNWLSLFTYQTVYL